VDNLQASVVFWNNVIAVSGHVQSYWVRRPVFLDSTMVIDKQPKYIIGSWSLLDARISVIRREFE